MDGNINLINARDIYQFSYDEIPKLFKNYSREITPPSNIVKGITKEKIGNLLEDTKTNILNSLSMQRDTPQFKKKQEHMEKDITIFFPKCTKKHAQHESPLDVVKLFGIFVENHNTNSCPQLPILKATYQSVDQNV
jgi:hypothetical protein